MPDLVQTIRDALAAATDPVKAPAMQRYMKSALPFHGVSSPDLKRIVRPLIAAQPLGDRAAWEASILDLWEPATHREQRYAALELACHRLYRHHQDPAAMPLYRHLIVTGAWWDLVDWVAPHLVGTILRANPTTEAERLRAWAVADDFWLRRAAIICQLGAKSATDTALLTDAIEANLVGSRFGHEFFIRKAIGWALRQHARTDPDWVRAFVAERADALAPLSRREALKRLS